MKIYNFLKFSDITHFDFERLVYLHDLMISAYKKNDSSSSFNLFSLFIILFKYNNDLYFKKKIH